MSAAEVEELEDIEDLVEEKPLIHFHVHLMCGHTLGVDREHDLLERLHGPWSELSFLELLSGVFLRAFACNQHGAQASLAVTNCGAAGRPCRCRGPIVKGWNPKRGTDG